MNFLIKNVSPLSEKLFIHNKDSFRFFDKTEKEKEDVFVYFIDPPYSFWEVPEKINNLLQGIISSNFGSKIYLQSPDEPKQYSDRYSRFGSNYIFEYN